jgi:hypothetical protein
MWRPQRRGHFVGTDWLVYAIVVALTIAGAAAVIFLL